MVARIQENEELTPDYVWERMQALTDDSRRLILCFLWGYTKSTITQNALKAVMNKIEEYEKLEGK